MTKNSLMSSQVSKDKSFKMSESVPINFKVLNSLRASLLSTGIQITEGSIKRPVRNSRKRFYTRASSSQNKTRPITPFINFDTSMNHLMEIRSFIGNNKHSKSSKESRKNVMRLSKRGARYNYSYKIIHKGKVQKNILLAKKMLNNDTQNFLKITGTKPINTLRRTILQNNI